MYRPPGVTYSDRYLDREERYELARLRESGLWVRRVAARLGRSPSTVCRELARNACPRTGAYQPERAHRLAWERQRRPKPSRLSQHPRLRSAVQQMLDRRYSPEQVSGRLKVLYPGEAAMQVSHETIYQSIYLYPRGGLRRELQACLRTGRARRRRGRREMRGRIVGAVPIGQRPPEVEGRLVPGHHEGDLIMGSKASNSAVGTIVERAHRLPHPAAAARRPRRRHRRRRHHRAHDRPAALVRPDPDLGPRQRNGPAPAHHRRHRHRHLLRRPLLALAARQQREHNGLLREYLPKGTDLRAWTPAQLQRHRRRTQRPAPQAPRLPHPPRSSSLNSSNMNALRRPPESALAF